MRKLVFILPLLLSAAIARGQAPSLPQNEGASRFTQALIEALRACDRKTEGASVDMLSACAGARFGAAESYLIAAGTCHETGAREPCAEATKLRLAVTGVLEHLSRR